MTITNELKEIRTYLEDADRSIDISNLVLNGQSYWLDKYGHYKPAFYHGVDYYFSSWLKETLGIREARTILGSPELATVIGEFVENMIDL